MNAEDQIDTLKEHIVRQDSEIKALRDWRHEEGKRPNVDGLRFQSIEMTLLHQNTMMADGQKTLEKILLGMNGDDEKPGLRGRLDRLENTVAAWAKLMWFVLTALIALLVHAIWRAIGGLKL